MARLLVLDVLTGKGFYEAECNALDDFYKELQCGTFDIARRKIGGKRFDIFVDDEGLYAERIIPSVIDKSYKPMLVGNAIFSNTDNMGETVSLSDEDIETIKNAAIDVFDVDSGNNWNVVMADY